MELLQENSVSFSENKSAFIPMFFRGSDHLRSLLAFKVYWNKLDIHSQKALYNHYYDGNDEFQYDVYRSGKIIINIYNNLPKL